MSSLSFLVDPYADTLEMPISGDLGPVSAEWEREQIERHVGAQFQVVREIGRGGMGVVFLARDIALHRLVAIKVLRYEFTSSNEHRERFRREARMTARLSHPNIVPVHSFGEVPASPFDPHGAPLVYIVMKYVDGESLAERMRRERRLPVPEVQRIMRDLALALESAHRDGVVHRDLKAENILLERGTGRAMLTDFGVALLRSLDPVRADAMRAFGTPHYMSPEQAAGELDIDERSDLYSLGVLGYYMLSGELPFDGSSFQSLAAKHIAVAHEPLAVLMPSLPAPLSLAIERCLEKERDDRWRTGRALADALGPVPSRRRWFRTSAAKATAVTASTVAARSKIVAELALFAAAMKAVLKWTAF
ncbi:MAG TPA: serine/threonine-protein kinase [Gemmatimonadaceae bacterium]|jgi:serine/threonine-protein kinase|nr:serine/threonine-protein kinase [Gemmatimonadaceae bacterium]